MKVDMEELPGNEEWRRPGVFLFSGRCRVLEEFRRVHLPSYYHHPSSWLSCIAAFLPYVIWFFVIVKALGEWGPGMASAFVVL